jgi:hypothetical protein
MSNIFEENKLDSISDNTAAEPDNKLTIDNINKSIPTHAINEQNIELLKTHIEHRWRFFNINNRKLVEISVKHPDKDRLYVNSSGSWINFNLDPKYDVYVTSAKYCYTQN